MQKKAMISLPMRGETEESIKAMIARARKALEEKGYRVIDTYFAGEWADWDHPHKDRVNKSLVFLAWALESMAECEAVYFCRGWESAAGCQIEHVAAMKYGLTVLYEDTDASTPQKEA